MWGEVTSTPAQDWGKVLALVLYKGFLVTLLHRWASEPSLLWDWVQFCSRSEGRGWWWWCWTYFTGEEHGAWRHWELPRTTQLRPSSSYRWSSSSMQTNHLFLLRHRDAKKPGKLWPGLMQHMQSSPSMNSGGPAQREDRAAAQFRVTWLVDGVKALGLQSDSPGVSRVPCSSTVVLKVWSLVQLCEHHL